MAHEELRELTQQVIGSAIDVHQAIGPGFAERMYMKALQHELRQQEIPFAVEQSVRVRY